MSPNRCRLCPRAEHLTRQSINLRKKALAKKMDARVKPAHDSLALGPRFRGDERMLVQVKVRPACP